MSLFIIPMLSVLLAALLRPSVCLLSVRYFAPNGVGISDISKYNHFKVHIQTPRYTHVLEAFNHGYKTQTPLVGDPCAWMLMNKRKVVGRLNLCEGTVEYSLDGRAYRVGHKDGYGAVDAKAVGMGEAENNQDIPTDGDGRASSSGPADTRPYRINVFIFNDAKRAGALGGNINRETEELARLVDGIYLESGMEIRVNLAGILNMKSGVLDSAYVKSVNSSDIKKLIIDNIINNGMAEAAVKHRSAPNILGAFKKLIEPIKYHPHNLDTPLSKSDLSLLITDSPIAGDSSELYQHHGMSYFGGANGLNRAYSVVYAGPGDSKYFLAKKMAHEIAHSLGVHHDDAAGSIMEPSTCATCDDSPRRFSGQSKAQMGRFIEEYGDVFRIQGSEDEEPGRVVMSKSDARAYIKRHRRHGFNDIVSRRLGGRVPETSYFTYYLGLSLIFYLVSICMAIYYLK